MTKAEFQNLVVLSWKIEEALEFHVPASVRGPLKQTHYEITKVLQDTDIETLEK